MTHTNMNVAATFGQKMSPLWAIFSLFFNRRFRPDWARQERKTLPASRRRKAVSSVHPQHGTKALVSIWRKDNEAEWKLILAASSRPAQVKSKRAEALVQAFI